MRLRPLIDEVLGGDSRAEIRFEDVMRVDLNEVLGQERWVMASNLPYEIGTTLVLDALRKVPALDHFVVMVQREVAERMVAGPGDPAYGLPSVVVSLHADRPDSPPSTSSGVLAGTPGRFGRGGARSRGPSPRAPTLRCDWPRRDSGSGARCSVSPWRVSSTPHRENWRPPESTRGRAPSKSVPSSGCGSQRWRVADDQVVVRAPAKVNLSLRVRPRDWSGRHPLLTLFQAVTLFDLLEVVPDDEDSLTIEGAELDDGPENLVWRAVEAVRASVGRDAPIEDSPHKADCSGGGAWRGQRRRRRCP